MEVPLSLKLKFLVALFGLVALVTLVRVLTPSTPYRFLDGAELQETVLLGYVSHSSGEPVTGRIYRLRGTADQVAAQAERELGPAGWVRVEEAGASWLRPRSGPPQLGIWFSDLGGGIVEVGVYTATTPIERLLHFLGKR